MPRFSPVTVTSTVVETETRTATQRATVVVVEIEVSTVVSTSEVVISTAATQTDIVWETITTEVAKRDVAPTDTPSPEGRRAALSSSRGPGAPVKRGPSAPMTATTGLSRLPKQARQEAPTVTEYVTETVETTNVSTVLVTVFRTSTSVTTFVQVETRVLEAEVTTTITSTITFTTRPPSTVTITSTADIVPQPTASETDSSETPPSSGQQTPLSTPAIAGIAAGGSVLAIFLAGFIILSVRRRCCLHRSKESTAGSVTLDNFYYNSHHNSSSNNDSYGQSHYHQQHRLDENETLYGVAGTRPGTRSRSSTNTAVAGPAGVRTSFGNGRRSRDESGMGKTPPGMGMMIRQPTLPQISPPLPQFSMESSAAAHHAEEYKLPVSISGVDGANNTAAQHGDQAGDIASSSGRATEDMRNPGGGGSDGISDGYLTVGYGHGQGQGQGRPHHHDRNESGYTTLVGTPLHESPATSPATVVITEDTTAPQHQRRVEFVGAQGDSPDARHGTHNTRLQRESGRSSGFVSPLTSPPGSPFRSPPDDDGLHSTPYIVSPFTSPHPSPLSSPGLAPLGQVAQAAQAGQRPTYQMRRSMSPTFRPPVSVGDESLQQQHRQRAYSTPPSSLGYPAAPVIPTITKFHGDADPTTGATSGPYPNPDASLGGKSQRPAAVRYSRDRAATVTVAMGELEGDAIARAELAGTGPG
ncbi:uncharacterized protein C8A04DRAFT_31635 [Dichotomopilus funicola]|uniref:Transmembrane protein n=1 Tax=Dichotomopilus funicola TaxID=1934379 RepID=A0AAN6UXD1_9PEZI|nr:hypothetical protein C8A04DRAFT_31635 [Dichotomopilus funicola]